MFTENITMNLGDILSQYIVPSKELIQDFEKAARLISVEKGEMVVKQGELCNYFIFNKKGLFRVVNVTNNKEDTLLFGSSGDVFTSIHSYFANEPSIFSLIAVVDTEAWLISYNKMNHLSERYPELVLWMRNLLIEQLFSFEKRYLFFNNKTAEERFKNFLYLHTGSLRRTSIKYISRIVPLKYLAQYLKISQATLSRLRKKLVTNLKDEDLS